jgi:hypothetical protein
MIASVFIYTGIAPLPLQDSGGRGMRRRGIAGNAVNE